MGGCGVGNVGLCGVCRVGCGWLGKVGCVVGFVGCKLGNFDLNVAFGEPCVITVRWSSIFSIMSKRSWTFSANVLVASRRKFLPTILDEYVNTKYEI